MLDALQYPKYSWKICEDLKVISLILGLRLGYTEYMCFLCLWNSRDDSNHFSKVLWEPRQALTAGRFNVKHVPLADPKNVLLPPLHIKLGLMKCFVRAIDHQGFGFKYLKEKFELSKSDAKIIDGIFIGLEIRKLFADENFPKHLNTKNWKLGTH